MSFLGIDSRNFRNKVESTFCGVPTITDPFERRCRGAGAYLKILGTKKVLSSTWFGQYSKIGYS